MLLRNVLQPDGTVKEQLVKLCKCAKPEGPLGGICKTCGRAIPDWGKTPDHSKEYKQFH